MKSFSPRAPFILLVMVLSISCDRSLSDDGLKPYSISVEHIGTHYGHEYIDLGLPTGTLWASCNIGAEKPEDNGCYFAWGDTIGYKGKDHTFSWNQYKLCNGSDSTLKKYCYDKKYGNVDTLAMLELSDDAAKAKWSGKWRIPTKKDWEELLDTSYCIWEIDSISIGYKVISKNNGWSLYLPLAGLCREDRLYGNEICGYYWTSSLDVEEPNRASICFFGHVFYDIIQYSRCYGLSIRPVANPND